jgi:pimeloyl-ACP methyl ester carboxylesterase
MPASAIPALSYWPTAWAERTTSANDAQQLLAAAPSVVLLVHGYNNNPTEASAAYEQFRRYQTPEVRAALVSVYWPGDNWEGPLYYMQAIGKARRVAPLLAADLYAAARRRGYYRIDLIAHSLGARLVLETLRELLALLRVAPLPGLTIGRVVLMAGAVPTAYLEDEARQEASLHAPLQAAEGVLSLYSEKDPVLHWAFPLGQSVVGERFLPVALGRRAWSDGGRLPRPVRQERNVGAGHSDYWGGDSPRTAQLRQAAGFIRTFLPQLGTPPARTTARYDLPTRDTTSARATAASRELRNR